MLRLWLRERRWNSYFVLRATSEKNDGKSNQDGFHFQVSLIRNFRFGTVAAKPRVPGRLPPNGLARGSNNGTFAAAIINDSRYRIAISEYDICPEPHEVKRGLQKERGG